jgi:DNA-binding transcriptional LysR family regulator
MDRLEEWRVFMAVATLRSFAAAARQLDRSPQAVTRAVAALEARIGSRLLHRTTRSVSLSDDGERYLEKARRAVAELDALETPLDSSPELRGTLSVTAPALFGQLHVLPAVEAFLAMHTGVNARMLLVDRVVSLAEEGIDVAVRIGELPDSALRVRRVGQVRTLVVGSPAYFERHPAPRTLDTLAKHTCIAFLGTSPTSERWTFGARSVRVTPRLVVNTAQAAIDAAVHGLGITRVLSYQVAHLVESGALRVVLASLEPDPLPVHLVTLPGMPSRIADAFSELAATQLRDRLGP